MSQRVITIQQEPQLQRIRKQPSEVIKAAALDFSGPLLSGETITGVTIDDGGTGMIPAYAVSGQRVAIDIVGGNDGDQVPATVRITGSQGSVHEADLLLLVVDPAAQAVPVVITPDTMTWRGNWGAGDAYNPNHVVRYGASIYLSLRINTGVVPGADPETWLAWPVGGGETGFSDAGGSGRMARLIARYVDGDWRLEILDAAFSEASGDALELLDANGTGRRAKLQPRYVDGEWQLEVTTA